MFLTCLNCSVFWETSVSSRARRQCRQAQMLRADVYMFVAVPTGININVLLTGSVIAQILLSVTLAVYVCVCVRPAWMEHRKWRPLGSLHGCHESQIFFSGQILSRCKALSLCPWWFWCRSASLLLDPDVVQTKDPCWTRSFRPAWLNQGNLTVTTTGSCWNGGKSADLLGPLGEHMGCGDPGHQDVAQFSM